jgi:uncharacterized protein DUF3631
VAAAADTKQSLGIQLLADQRTVFGDTEVLATETILEPLHALEESVGRFTRETARCSRPVQQARQVRTAA